MTAAHSRRWFRFSLRTLFAVVTVAAVTFGAFYWLGPRSLSEAQARQMAAVRKAYLNDTISEEDARAVLGNEVTKLKGQKVSQPGSAPNR